MARSKQAKAEPTPAPAPAPVQPEVNPAHADTRFRLSMLWSKVPLMHPGKFEDCDRECKAVFNMPNETFGGYKVDIESPLSQQTSLTHSFVLGDRIREDQYGISIQHAILPNLAVTGRLETTGGFSFRTIGGINENAIASVQIQGIKTPGGRQWSGLGDATFAGPDYAVTVKMTNDLVPSFSLMHAVTDRLSAGCEVMHAVKSRNTAITSALRYMTEKDALTLQHTSYGSLAVGYARVLSERSMLCAQLLTNLTKRESSLMLGYNRALSNGTARVMVDTVGMLRSVISFQVLQGMTTTLCGEVDYKTANARFGVGITLG